jgi:hypothetical protein
MVEGSTAEQANFNDKCDRDEFADSSGRPRMVANVLGSSSRAMGRCSVFSDNRLRAMLLGNSTYIANRGNSGHHLVDDLSRRRLLQENRTSRMLGQSPGNLQLSSCRKCAKTLKKPGIFR